MSYSGEVDLICGAAKRPLEVIDESVELYLGMRGIERAVLPLSDGLEHQENDAEHTFHVTLTVTSLLRSNTLLLPKDFSIEDALSYPTVHDLPEIEAGDCVFGDEVNSPEKEQKEQEALDRMTMRYQSSFPLIRASREYIKKDTPEKRFVSDVDKLAALRLIMKCNPDRWRNGRHLMDPQEHKAIIDEKIQTPFGRGVLDLIAKELYTPKYFDPVLST